jgi:ParB-like chromosome segregation protein Spo0J
MEIREIQIKDIEPAPYNPRVDLQPDDAEYKRIEKSLDEFSLVEPLVWNEATGNLVSGHQRLKICIARGITEVTCSVVNIDDPKKEAALNIALNNAFGKWDFPKLKDVIAGIDDGSFDIDITGFGQGDLINMFGYGDDSLPDRLDDTDIKGEDTRDSSFIFVYADEFDKEFFMKKFGIDGKKRIYTRQDFE